MTNDLWHEESETNNRYDNQVYVGISVLFNSQWN